MTAPDDADTEHLVISFRIHNDGSPSLVALVDYRRGETTILISDSEGVLAAGSASERQAELLHVVLQAVTEIGQEQLDAMLGG
jgi:hypothetical protein